MEITAPWRFKRSFAPKFCVAFLAAWVAVGSNRASAQAPTAGEQAYEAGFWNAQKFKITERFDEAIRAFEECEQLQPRLALPKVELAKLHHRQKRADLALDYSAKAEATADIDPRQLAELAEIHSSLGLTRSAAGLLQRAVDLNPNDLALLYELASVQIDARMHPEALITLDRIEAREGLTPEVGQEKKRLFLLSGDLEAAAKQLDALDKAFPAGRVYSLEKADLYRANGQTDKAVKIWKDILNREPENAFALLGLAAVQQEEGQYEASYLSLKRAMKSPELNIDAKISVLLSFYQASEQSPELRDRALELLAIAEEVHPREAKVFAMKGDFMVRDRRWPEARDAYRKAVQLPQGSLWPIWMQLLSIEAELRDWEALYNESQTAIAEHPNQAWAWLFLGTAAEQKTLYAEARTAYETGSDLAFGQPELLSRFEMGLGMSCDALKDYPSSDKHFKRALQLEPDNPLYLNNYAWVLSERSENLQEALKLSIRANQLEPRNANSMDTWAWVLFKLGEYEKALNKIDEALALSSDAVFLEHRAAILEKLGRTPEAKQTYEQAIQLIRSQGREPDHELLNRAKALTP